MEKLDLSKIISLDPSFSGEGGGSMSSGNGQNLYDSRIMAQLFGFEGPRRIEQLTHDGVIDAVLVKVNGREVRRYDLVPTIQKYVKHCLKLITTEKGLFILTSLLI